MNSLNLSSAGSRDYLADDEANRFLIQSRGEIAAILRDMARSGTVLTASFQSGKTTHQRLLSLAHVDEWVVLDSGHDTQLVWHLIGASAIRFEGKHGTVPVEFTARDVRAITGAAGGFAVPIPEQIVRRQKRDGYRLVTPLHDRPRCLLGSTVGAIEARVVDISVGGVGLVLPAANAHWARVGRRVARSMITIPGEEGLMVQLEVCHRQSPADPDGLVHMGCRFVNLPPRVYARIQRYIHRMELRERRYMG